MTAALRLLCADFVNLADVSALIDASSVPWESMTLRGERHQVRLILSGPDAEAIAARLKRLLPDHEFALPGLLVADLAITATDRTSTGLVLTLEALTLDEAVSPVRTPG